MNDFLTQLSHRHAYLALLLVAMFSLWIKLGLLGTGAPYVTIDDYTLFEAGFLVWFGEAPPQRMYFESWLVGASSLVTYLSHLIASGNLQQLGLNLIADAYADFHQSPDDYVTHYRLFMLAFDMATAMLVFKLALLIYRPINTGNTGFTNTKATWLACAAASLFLLSYNTTWCYIVARPDTVTAFFAALGSYYYFKSQGGANTKYLCFAALALGCATGFKLHAALFVVFFIVDMLRQFGLAAFKRSFMFGLIAFCLFLVTAGSPLFDPLLYVKLRALNIKDDASPWIHWGDQIGVTLRGTGWLILPLLIGLAVTFLRTKLTRTQAVNSQAANNRAPSPHDQAIISLVFVACLFMLFFLSIRQLRAYWMLPALPLFYVAALYAVAQVKSKWAIGVSLVVIFGMFLQQFIQQSHEFDKAQFGEMRTWVSANVQPHEVIYIVGYETLFLPCNTQCLANRKFSLETRIQQAIAAGESFTERHIRNWEERAKLQLIDMLNEQAVGFNYYTLNGAPLKSLYPKVKLADIEYLIVLPGYHSPEADELLHQVLPKFTKVATTNAPGGKAGTGGLAYDIYKRKQP